MATRPRSFAKHLDEYYRRDGGGFHFDEPGTRSLAGWFLGPKAENEKVMQELLSKALEEHCKARREYAPHDPVFVTPEIKESEEYKHTIDYLRTQLNHMLEELHGSIPLASYRNQSHMYWDCTLPGFIGYFAAMLYNQNNVAAEASPVSTFLEIQVGADLCAMLGYPRLHKDGSFDIGVTRPWGHITCDGSVANSESMWAARNLKYFPVAVAHALRDEPSLKAAANMLVPLPSGERARLIDLSGWQMLNLGVDDVIELSTRIQSEYAIEKETLEAALENYRVQNIGLTAFYTKFLKDESIGQPVILAPSTMHYSWPKSAALIGLGKHTLIPIRVDLNCRMDVAHLRSALGDALANRTPVMQVVAVMGTTEESAVDPLAEILAIREEFRSAGLEFVLHLDAAWGGYFKSMLNEPHPVADQDKGHTPVMWMSEYVKTQYLVFQEADSITVDPHKAGFIPYPAGALCYRNGAMRDLVSFTAPVVYHGGTDPTVGVYGIEGSKPGAAAAGVYLSHKVIRTDRTGYGRILGKCIWNSKRLYAGLLSMPKQDDPFIVVPVQRLPAYKEAEAKGWTQEEADEKAKAQLKLIRDSIAPKTNQELLADRKAMALFRELGSDQNIITYSFNFKNEDGSLNPDVDLANALNQAVFNKLSKQKYEPSERGKVPANPMFVTSSNFTSEGYGQAFVDEYMRRLKLTPKADATVNFIISTTQDPWVTDTAPCEEAPDGNMIPAIMAVLRTTVLECIKDLPAA